MTDADPFDPNTLDLDWPSYVRSTNSERMTAMPFSYEPGTLEVSAFKAGDEEGDDLDEKEDIEGFKIFNSRVGHIDDVWVAFSRDCDVAVKLVELLNADERIRTRRAT